MFQIRNASNVVVATITTNAQGVATATLPPGTYSLIEISVPPGVILDPTPSSFSIVAGQTTVRNRTNVATPV